MKEKAQLEKTIETLRENSERQVHKFPIKQCILKFINNLILKFMQAKCSYNTKGKYFRIF